jgi:transcriptional regulator with XRE-family HTH domain
MADKLSKLTAELERARLARGWSVVELASHLVIDQNHLGAILRGRREMTPGVELKARKAGLLSPIKVPK